MEFIEKLKKDLSTYFHATEIPLMVLNESGQELEYIGEMSNFCKFFRECAGDHCPCSQTHLYACRQTVLLGEPYIFTCPTGLVHFAVPLIQKNTFKGTALAGPVLLEFPDVSMTDEILQKYELPVNLRGKISSTLRMLPVVETDKLRHLSNLLFLVVSSLMGEEKQLLTERSEKFEQQSLLSESIQELKNDAAEPFYPVEEEKELVTMVKNGDRDGARILLNDLLAHLFLSSGGNLEIIKAKTLELCTLLSRTSAQSGAELYNQNFYSEITALATLEDLTFWLVKLLDRFTERVFMISDSKNAVVVQNAITYINANFSKGLTLEMVAGHVHLNPSYFSSLFKKETGLSYTGYLNQVRIEKSKLLLKKYSDPISVIAQEVGFEDQSYFTKVFKAITKMTPREYKKN